MPELIWILDPTTGDLVVEGLEAEEALALAGDLLPDPEDLNCAQPLQIRALPDSDVAGVPSLHHPADLQMLGDFKLHSGFGQHLRGLNRGNPGTCKSSYSS